MGNICENYGVKRETVHYYLHEMLTAVACDQRWPDAVAGISAHFSKFAFVLFCYITNHLMIGPLGNIEILKKKFTVPLATNHEVLNVILRRGDITHGNLCMWVTSAAWWLFRRSTSQLADQ